MKIPELETERLILRRHEEKDFADMREYLSDEKVVAFEPYLPMSDDEVRECLRERMGSDEFIAVEEKAYGKMIGNLYVGERFCDSVEIGYVLNRSFWQKGYATEACRKVMEFVFSQGKHRLEAECDPRNEASWRLLERLGFRREGFLQKNVYFHTDEAGNPIWKDSFLYAKRKDADALPEQIQKLEVQMWEVCKGDGETLHGVSGSAGRAEGRVCVVRSPEEFSKLQKGDVMVCPYTDPEWTPLFALAAAVVSDTGGVLSHAAIVAREYRIPAVLAVGNATTALVDGDWVLVDGSKGEVDK